MKVSLQHTADLEEVPLIVNEKCKKQIDKLRTLGNISKCLDILQPDKFVSDIDFIRQNLYSIDNVLSECASLMSEYNNAKKASENIVDPEADSIEDRMAEFNERREELRRHMPTPDDFRPKLDEVDE